MKKIIIIGCPGSGKSTFAQKLQKSLSLPLYHLDMIWHKPDKTTVTKEEFDARLDEIISDEEWIIDGNYKRTLEKRISACDTVILFDLPTFVCISGAKERIGKKRVDMPWVEEELDPEFKAWIEGFRNEQLPEIYRLLEKYNDKRIVIFKSREEADLFIAGDV